MMLDTAEGSANLKDNAPINVKPAGAGHGVGI